MFTLIGVHFLKSSGITGAAMIEGQPIECCCERGGHQMENRSGNKIKVSERRMSEVRANVAL